MRELNGELKETKNRSLSSSEAHTFPPRPVFTVGGAFCTFALLEFGMFSVDIAALISLSLADRKAT